MSFTMLTVCRQELVTVTARQYLPCLCVANSIFGNKHQLWNNPYSTLKSVTRRKNYLDFQQEKLCSSSVAKNPYTMKQMKEKLNGYVNIIYKGSDINFAHITVASKDFLQTLKADIAELKSCPTPPLVLGFGGLIPFVAAPMNFIMSATFSPGVAYAQLAYGAAILSFLGGIRWGVALANPKWESLIRSVIPSLVGWSSLLLPHWLGCVTLSAGLVSLAVSDRKHPQYQPWFRSLRTVLTTVAVLSIVGSMGLNIILPMSK